MRRMVISGEECLVFQASRFGRPRKPAPSYEELACIRKTMTLKQIADKWNVSTRTVNRWISRSGLSGL